MPFAALAAALFLDERISTMGFIGCCIILLSVTGAEILPLLKNKIQNKSIKSTNEKRSL